MNRLRKRHPAVAPHLLDADFRIPDGTATFVCCRADPIPSCYPFESDTLTPHDVVITAATIRDRRWMRRIPREVFIWLAGVGLCNGLAVLLLYTALSLGPVVLVSPTVASYPLITIVLRFSLLRTGRPTARLGIGVAMTVAGVAVLLISKGCKRSIWD